MDIQKLQWDSDFFGYPVGKVEFSNKGEFSYELFRKEAHKFKLVYIFSNEMLENDKLNLVDLKVVLSQKLTPKMGFISIDENIKSYNEVDYDYQQLKDLALASGVYSRFNNDENFEENEYTKLYERWIENLAIRGRAFDICIYCEYNKILGFTTIEEKTPQLADIGLVAVDKLARGKGIGTKLIENAKHRAYLKGFKAIQVVTQSANIRAVELYKRCNFKIENQNYIYHYWNK